MAPSLKLVAAAAAVAGALADGAGGGFDYQKYMQGAGGASAGGAGDYQKYMQGMGGQGGQGGSGP
eukprot:CAMPEP_0195054472 /NCGR_PEP_ID=MMETSP0448-20130528/3414_1 /TAXON_ID=66468 /ORGANISM="Heterocapsa triquestra, Strain CCMP 448" /LENGTH=64 /DNA_ID=CAMNT_0040083989 /DNA_START=65 /DNA_END=256 /DNA_ORIENTATION=+